MAAIARGEVRVGWLDLSSPPQLATLLEHLDPLERERSLGYATPPLRAAAALRAALRRSVLAEWLGVPPAELVLLRGVDGRLSVPLGEGLAWVSASSHGTVGVVGIAADARLGIDVAAVGAIAEPHRFVERALSSSERGELEGLGPTELDEAVARVWARKEAILKATGEGVGANVGRLEVPAGVLTSPRRCAHAGANWWLLELSAPAGHVAAAATDAPAHTALVVDARVRTAAHLEAAPPRRAG